ncbi:MAG: hypothetical protein SFW09_15190 [Hyphomicrobiaceae bacterium]|nr:hypothetical protein [Hyphomicrobiaceae bacterium]
MNERVTVDMSRVDEALRLSAVAGRLEADKRDAINAQERAKATAKLILYGAAALSLVIVSIGFAVSLANDRHNNRTKAPFPVEVFDPGIEGTGTKRAQIMTSVNLFNTIKRDTLKTGNPFLKGITAGHKYKSSESKRWDDAWCYADFTRDDLDYTLTLENRTLWLRIPRPPTAAELKQLSLSTSDVDRLRAECPWRDR